MLKKKKEILFEVTTDNVFADIGIENPEEELTKAELAWEIAGFIKSEVCGISCKKK